MIRNMTILVLLVILSPIVYGASIQGIVYDNSLDVRPNVIVDIDTSPRQQMIAKNGSYRFNVPSGDYTIRARYVQDGILQSSDEANLTVQGDGEFVLDFILFPAFIEETILEESESVDVDVDLGGARVFSPLMMGLFVLVVLILGFIIYKFTKRMSKETKEGKEAEGHAEGDDLKQYIDFIRKHKRVTQKDIRKEFPLSEAKISLIITDLESKGIIKKIKKGRGNVIIYTES